MLGLSRRALYRRLERLDLSDTITRRRDADDADRGLIMVAESHGHGRAPTPQPRSAVPRRRDVPRTRVLIVDDENGVARPDGALARVGRLHGRDRGQRRGGARRLNDQPPAVALCDIRMPGHDGLWLAERIRQQYPETAVIMATGVQDVGPGGADAAPGGDRLPDQAVRTRAPARGRDARPRVAPLGLGCAPLARIARAGDGDPALAAERCASAALEFDSDEAVDAMLVDADADRSRGLRARLPRRRAGGQRRAHARRARRGSSPRSSTAALLHDIGKLAMPEAILRKPAPLTVGGAGAGAPPSDARRPSSSHACPTSQHAVPIVRDAHERMDGLGYPERDPRRRGLARRAHRLRRRCLRHDDPAPRVPRRDRPAARRCSNSSAAAARSSTRSSSSAFRRVLDAL